MKKYLLITAVMLGVGVSLVRADKRLVPTGEQNSLATADYGGVDYFLSTASFLSSGAGIGYGTASVANTSGVFYGIIFSTGSTSDYYDVFDATSADMAKLTNAGIRVYNVGASSGGVGAFGTGFSGPIKPVRYNKGLIVKPSRTDLNTVMVLYYQQP